MKIRVLCTHTDEIPTAPRFSPDFSQNRSQLFRNYLLFMDISKLLNN